MKTIRSFMRPIPGEIQTASDRSKERLRRIFLSTAASALVKGINMVTALVTVPLTINYLGTERYGVWMTISSLIAILGFADLGLGNGLLNAVSEANGKDDQELAKRYVSSAFFLLTGIALLLLLVFFLSYPYISWARIFNIQSAAAVQEAGPALIVFIACFLINLPLGIVQRVQLGYQEGYASSVWQGVGNLLGLVMVLVVIYFQGGLPWLVFAMAGSPVIATMINGIYLFGRQRPWLRPKLRDAHLESGKKIVQLGFLFFVLQLAVAMAYSSDNIVVAQILGSEAVTQYSVPMRLFNFIPTIAAMAIYPLWPAYGESITRGDYHWVKRVLTRSLIASVLITGVPVIPMIIFGKEILQLWAGPEIQPTLLLLVGLGIWTVMGTVGNALAMFLNGANIVGFQVVMSTIMAVSALGLKIFLTPRMGVPGVIWGTIIAYTIFMLIPYGFFIPKFLSGKGQTSRPAG